MAVLLDHFHRMRRHRLSLLRPGARQLLDHTEWEVERVLHLARGAVWLGVILLALFVWQAPVGTLIAATATPLLHVLIGQGASAQVSPGSAADRLISAVVLGVAIPVWIGYWHVLHRYTAWRRLRFLLIFLDVMTTVRFSVGVRAVGLAGPSLSGTLNEQQIAGLVPALLVLITLAGALRLNPFVTAFSGLVSFGGLVAVTLVLRRSFSDAFPELAMLWLTFVLSMQLVFVLRGMALKAAEEEVLERYVPQGLTQRLSQAGGSVPARVVPVTILIADIRGFTTVSEPLGPQQAVALLNDFFATMVGPLVAEEAVLDKYLGDGMLAFVEGPEHAARGLRAARAIVSAVEASNARRQPPLRIGIAVHTAEAFVGSIGAPARMEYTIIGDAVNVTSRLEGLTSSKAGAERIDASLVASGEAVAQARADGFALPELLGPREVTVHGRSQPLDVYYLPATASAHSAGARASAGHTR